MLSLLKGLARKLFISSKLNQQAEKSNIIQSQIQPSKELRLEESGISSDYEKGFLDGFYHGDKYSSNMKSVAYYGERFGYVF